MVDEAALSLSFSRNQCAVKSVLMQILSMLINGTGSGSKCFFSFMIEFLFI